MGLSRPPKKHLQVVIFSKDRPLQLLRCTLSFLEQLIFTSSVEGDGKKEDSSALTREATRKKPAYPASFSYADEAIPSSDEKADKSKDLLGAVKCSLTEDAPPQNGPNSINFYEYGSTVEAVTPHGQGSNSSAPLWHEVVSHAPISSVSPSSSSDLCSYIPATTTNQRIKIIFIVKASTKSFFLSYCFALKVLRSCISRETHKAVQLQWYWEGFRQFSIIKELKEGRTHDENDTLGGIEGEKDGDGGNGELSEEEVRSKGELSRVTPSKEEESSSILLQLDMLEKLENLQEAKMDILCMKEGKFLDVLDEVICGGKACKYVFADESITKTTVDTTTSFSNFHLQGERYSNDLQSSSCLAGGSTPTSSSHSSGSAHTEITSPRKLISLSQNSPFFPESSKYKKAGLYPASCLKATPYHTVDEFTASLPPATLFRKRAGIKAVEETGNGGGAQKNVKEDLIELKNVENERQVLKEEAGQKAEKEVEKKVKQEAEKMKKGAKVENQTANVEYQAKKATEKAEKAANQAENEAIRKNHAEKATKEAKSMKMELQEESPLSTEEKNDTLRREEVDLLMFLVDDVVFIRPIPLATLFEVLSSDNEVFSVSMRLHLGVEYCFTRTSYIRTADLKMSILLPDEETLPGRTLYKLERDDYHMDWSLPFDLSCSVYRTKHIQELLQGLQKNYRFSDFSHPNLLESRANEYLQSLKRGAHKQELQRMKFIGFFANPRAVIITINRVQDLYTSNEVYEESYCPLPNSPALVEACDEKEASLLKSMVSSSSEIAFPERTDVDSLHVAFRRMLLGENSKKIANWSFLGKFWGNSENFIKHEDEKVSVKSLLTSLLRISWNFGGGNDEENALKRSSNAATACYSFSGLFKELLDEIKGFLIKFSHLDSSKTPQLRDFPQEGSKAEDSTGLAHTHTLKQPIEMPFRLNIEDFYPSTAHYPTSIANRACALLLESLSDTPFLGISLVPFSYQLLDFSTVHVPWLNAHTRAMILLKFFNFLQLVDASMAPINQHPVMGESLRFCRLSPSLPGLPTPLVSWLIPVHNAANTIELSISSAFRQEGISAALIEIVVVDDNSTDDTRAILKNLSLKDQRIRVFSYPIAHKEVAHQVRKASPRGVGAALSLGLTKCRGKYIARLDADDFAKPSRLCQQVFFMEMNEDVGVCGSNVELFDSTSFQKPTKFDPPSFPPKPYRICRFPKHPVILRWHLLFECPIAHPTVMMRASSLLRRSEEVKKSRASPEQNSTQNSAFKQEPEAFNYSEECVAEDHWLWLSLPLDVKFSNLSLSLTALGRGESNLSKKRNLELRRSSQQAVLKWINDRVCEHNQSSSPPISLLAKAWDIEHVALMWEKGSYQQKSIQFDDICCRFEELRNIFSFIFLGSSASVSSKHQQNERRALEQYIKDYCFSILNEIALMRLRNEGDPSFLLGLSKMANMECFYSTL